ncbi:DUF3800 domain-containing protein [Devosia sp.]|uniref:DUF3800 domain-containing protein n=1 Tax=Devosia sp. TaxID=1871048 RepID=UPI0032677A8B
MNLILSELARGILPYSAKEKVVGVLFGYFDESGTHGGADKQCIAGMIGRADDWDDVSSKWDTILGDRAFHYTHMNRIYGNGQFKGVPQAERTALIEACADAVGSSDLLSVCGGFVGDWKQTIAGGAGWNLRFPSCYSYCLEMCLMAMNKLSAEKWQSEPIALVFSQQDQYRDRAFEVFNIIKNAGEYPNLATFTYAPMKQLRPLQVADMFAYETFKVLGETDPAEFRKWPLTRRVIQQGRSSFGGFGSPELLTGLLREAEIKGRQYYKNPA